MPDRKMIFDGIEDPQFKLKKCPFCGSVNPKIYNVHGLFMAGCPACCARSGLQHEREQAVRYWNMRNGHE